MDTDTRRIGIYIDLSNIELSLAEYNSMGLSLDYSQLIRCIAGDSSIAVLNAYDGNVSEESYQRSVQVMLEGIGVNMVLTEPCKELIPTTTRYANVQKEVDTGITTDVSWDLATNKIDAAYIVSGDRDMRPALTRAVREGKEVHIVSLRCAIGEKYASMLDDCLYVDDFEVFLVNGSGQQETVGNAATYSIIEEVACNE